MTETDIPAGSNPSFQQRYVSNDASKLNKDTSGGMAPASSAGDELSGQAESYDAYEVFCTLADLNGTLHGVNRALGNGSCGDHDDSDAASPAAKHSAADVDPAWKGVKLNRASTQAVLDDMRSMLKNTEVSMNKMNKEHYQKWIKKLSPSASDKSSPDLYPLVHEFGSSPTMKADQRESVSSEGSVSPEVRMIFGDDLIKRDSVMKTGLKHARNMLNTSCNGNHASEPLDDSFFSDLTKVESSADPLDVVSDPRSISDVGKKVNSTEVGAESNEVPIHFDSRLSMPEWMELNKGWFEASDQRIANSGRRHQDVKHTLKQGFNRWLNGFSQERDRMDEDAEHEAVMARMARDSARSTRNHKIEMARIAESSARGTRQYVERMASMAEDSTRDTWKHRVEMARIAEDSARDDWVHEIEMDRIEREYETTMAKISEDSARSTRDHEIRMALIDQGVY